MTRIIIQPLELHTGQRTILDHPARFKVASCGRRFGKTMLAVEWLALEEGGAADGAAAAFFSPTYKLLLDVWSDMERTLKPITAKANKTEMRIELVTGGKIDFWTLEDEDEEVLEFEELLDVFVPQPAMAVTAKTPNTNSAFAFIDFLVM